MKTLIWIFAALSCPLTFGDTTGENFSYAKGAFEGFVARPQGASSPAPGILMIHNWMGVSDETRFQAKRFAELGYVVLAADVYGKGVQPKDAAEAGSLAGKFKGDRKLFRNNLLTALDALKALKGVDPKRLAVVGYCFGGTGALELARAGAPVKAAVSFHGGLDSPTPADGKKIRAEVLAHHGAIDPFVKAEDVAAFEAELKAAKVKYELIRYPGAVHSFTEKAAGTDTSKGAAYNAEADAKSFETTRAFLKRVFGV